MAQHIASIRLYVNVFVTLIVLLLLTILAAHFEMGSWNLAVALTIAVLKALVVVLYFMHLRWSSHQTWVFACAAVFWFAIMISLSMSDYLTRATPQGQRIYAPGVVPIEQQSVAIPQRKTP